jgi:hypothetical protein
LSPLPGRERVRVRVETHELKRRELYYKIVQFDPHPSPLPARERE